MTRRVVITGLGAVTPLGVGVPVLWQGLLEGKSGIATVTSFDASNMRAFSIAPVASTTIFGFTVKFLPSSVARSR